MIKIESLRVCEMLDANRLVEQDGGDCPLVYYVAATGSGFELPIDGECEPTTFAMGDGGKIRTFKTREDAKAFMRLVAKRFNMREQS